MNDDERLIARVREAAQTGISVAAVEAAVGTPATFTTARQSLEIMRHADLVPDPDHRSDPWIHEEVVGAAYWTRPVATHNPRVVGIVYAKDGSTKVFFAEVYPP